MKGANVNCQPSLESSLWPSTSTHTWWTVSTVRRLTVSICFCVTALWVTSLTFLTQSPDYPFVFILNFTYYDFQVKRVIWYKMYQSFLSAIGPKMVGLRWCSMKFFHWWTCLMLVLSSLSCLSFVSCVFGIILCLCHQPSISTTRPPLFSFLLFPFVPLTQLFWKKAVLPCSFSCFNFFVDVKVFGKVLDG